MINLKIAKQILSNVAIFLIFLSALILAGPYAGFDIFGVDDHQKCSLNWFNLTFLMICAYTSSCLVLWIKKTIFRR